MFIDIRRFARILAAAGFRNARLAAHIVHRRVVSGLKIPIIVFDIGTVGLREHVSPVVEWLLNRSSTFIILVFAEDQFEVGNAMRFAGEPSSRISRMNRSDYRLMPFTPHVTVSLHPETGTCLKQRVFNTGRRRTQRVVMQHGLSDKAAFSDLAKKDTLADFDVVFLVGPVFNEGSLRDYAAKYPETFARLRFVEVGSPKTDTLFHPTRDRASILGELGLDPSRTTVCYAPTWESSASLEQCGVEIIEALAELDVNCIVKLHHLSVNRSPAEAWGVMEREGVNWVETVRLMERRFPRLRLATGQDANPYLTASDVLVSDVSGVAFEYMLLDKPIVFFDVPKLFEHYGKAGIHYWGREGGDVVTSLEDLKVVVLRNIADPDQKRAERRKWASRISFSQGDSARRAGEEILKLAEEAEGGSR